MNKILILLIIALSSCSTTKKKRIHTFFLIGNFQDDYEVSYSISDSLFEMGDHTKLHILRWNLEEQYFVGQNDSLNPYDPLLYTRLDWMKFENMQPFEWGFCMSAYNAISIDSAIAVSTSNREVPKTGCNGRPFSRMKRINN